MPCCQLTCNQQHAYSDTTRLSRSHSLIVCVAVNPLLLTGDAVSDSLFSNYNSVDVQVTVTIDNKAWYPDLGSVATTNHNRLANILNSEGYIVVSWHSQSKFNVCNVRPVNKLWKPDYILRAVSLEHKL